MCVRVSASAVARACSHACLHIFESDSVRALGMLKGLYEIRMSLVWRFKLSGRGQLTPQFIECTEMTPVLVRILKIANNKMFLKITKDTPLKIHNVFAIYKTMKTGH